MDTGFMGVGAIAPDRKTHLVVGQMGVGAIKSTKKVNSADEKPEINQTDYNSMPFFKLKKIAIDKGYAGEIKKEPILAFLQSNS